MDRKEWMKASTRYCECMISDAVIESWSRERGRGSVRATSFGSLPFDASVADVGGFVVGESVKVTLESVGGSFRVVRVAATHPDDNSGARFPYNLLIWRSSYAAVSPSGARRAEIAHAGELHLETREPLGHLP